MKNCEMILAGFGGQGILFTGKILAFAAMLKDKKLSWLPSYDLKCVAVTKKVF